MAGKKGRSGGARPGSGYSPIPVKGTKLAPNTEIDLNVLEGLLSIGATREEIRAVLRISEDTLLRRYKDTPAVREAMDAGAAKGRVTLRRSQWHTATVDNNPTMQIWLGKQLLGQRDFSQIAHTGANGGAIKTEYSYADLKDLSSEDLWALREILTRRAAAEEEQQNAGGSTPRH